MERINDIKFIKDKHDISIDNLDHTNFAGHIKTAIDLADPPFTMALYGCWGTGKTALLERLKEILNEDGHLTVWFDAWKYEKEPNLLWPLLKRIQKDAKPLLKEEEIKDKSLTLLKKIGLKVLDRGLQSAVSITTSGAITGFGLQNIKELLNEDKKNDALDNYIDEINFLEEKFSEYTNLLLSRQKDETKKLVILIDDLDRCTPDNMVALIEGIKLFLYSGQCIFLYALDKKVVSEAVTRKYKGMEGFDGERYLEKIFEFSFVIPPPEESQLDNIANGYYFYFDKMGIKNDGGGQRLLVLTKAANKDNPRVLKRFFNKLIFLSKVLEGSKTLDFEYLAWIFIFESWPEFRKLLNRMDPECVHECINKIIGSSIKELKKDLGGTDTGEQNRILTVIRKYPESEKYLVDPYLQFALKHFITKGGDEPVKVYYEAEEFCRKYGI